MVSGVSKKNEKWYLYKKNEGVKDYTEYCKLLYK